MAETTSMDDILNDAPPPKPEAPAEPSPPAERNEAAPEKPEANDDYRSRKQKHQEKEFNAQGLVRDAATGQFAKKEAEPQEQKPDAGATTVAAQPVPAASAAPAGTPAQPPVEQLTAKEAAFLARAQDETRKRQELERRLAALEKPAEPAKTFWDDPEAAMKAQDDKIAQAVASTALRTSEIIARNRYADFDEKVAEFGKLCAANPWLAAQCQQSPDPADFAYKTGKSHQELQQLGGIEQIKEKVRQETEAAVRVKIEAELKAKAEALAAERAAIPGSLSNARSTGVNKPVWNGPTPFNDILAGPRPG